MMWFGGGADGVRLDKIISPLAAASSHDLGFAGSPFPTVCEPGRGGLAVVRVLGICSSLSRRAIESSAPLSLISRALSRRDVSLIILGVKESSFKVLVQLSILNTCVFKKTTA